MALVRRTLLPHSLRLAQPLLLSLWHRLGREARGRRRPGPTALAAAAAYLLVFAFLTRTLALFAGTIEGLLSLRGFSSGAPGDLVLQLLTAGVGLAMTFLLVLDVAGPAARSLDTDRDGRDLLLLAALPVRPGAVIVSRGLAAALLDPLGLLLLGPPLTACALTQGGVSIPAALLLALPAHLLLRGLVHTAALGLILANRCMLPVQLRAEAAALLEAALLAGLLAVSTGLAPLELAASFRSASSLLDPLSDLARAAAPAAPTPLRWLLEGTLTLIPGLAARGWAAGALLFALAAWLGGLAAPHRLLSRTRKIRQMRPMGWLWDRGLPRCRHPAAAFLLKDAIVLWRANLLMAPLLPVILPAALGGLLLARPLLLTLPAPLVLVPALLLCSTALTAALLESCEGPRPPPMPFASARVALWKGAASTLLTVALSLGVLLAAVPLEQTPAFAAWTVLAAVLLPCLLAELLAVFKGGASEVFSPQGLRLAGVWSVTAVGLATLVGTAPLWERLVTAGLACILALVLRDRDRLLRFDRSPSDMAVLLVLYVFGVRSLGVLAGLASALGPAWSSAAGPAATALAQLGLLFTTFAYLARSGGHPVAALGLPAGRPLRRGVLPLLAGLALAALFAWLGGPSGRPPSPAHGAVSLALLQMFLASGLGPLAEECFFRGLFQSSFAAVAGRGAAALLSATAFALSHPGPPSVTLLVLGGLLAWLRDRRASVYEPFIAHMVFNHVQVAASLLAAEAAWVMR